MHLTDAQATPTYLIRDRDAKYPAPFDEILRNAGIQVVRTGIRIPRMNVIMERWLQTCRHELLDRTLVWYERHLRHALRQFELHYNARRPHQAIDQTAPLRAAPEPLSHAQITQLTVRRRDPLGGVLHE
ncbi:MULTISPECIES: integrase core domain-containing protein [unclassified Streptomyces]|uniref:integrase core domain-containing protein n=1 Tax=unclassified Streptomyces TaxID=2593676 RepID=UPI002E17CCF8